MPDNKTNDLPDERPNNKRPQQNRPPQKKTTKETGQKKSVRILWRTFWIGLISFNVLIILINLGALGYMPSMKELENPSSALASDVYASDGTLISRYYIQDRSTSKYEEISPNIYNALLATEDARFYEHSGIDPVATVAIPFYVLTGKKRGSSTITQQLAKNLFPRENQNIVTLPFIKLKEWVMAVKLERNLTKNEVITLYLNTVPFGDNVYGIRNASLTFYKKMPDSVTVDEAAVLIGMLKGNTIYNPRRNPERSKERRNVVITQMADHGFITEAEAAELVQKPIKLDYHKMDYHTGMAPYFAQVVEQDVKKMLEGLKKSDGTEYNIYKDGLKIYTTLDVTMQRYAEQAVSEHMSEIQRLFSGQRSYRDGTVWKKHQKYLMEAIKASDRYEVLKEKEMTHEEIMKELRKPVKMTVFAWNKKRQKDTTMSPIDSIKYMKMFLQTGFMAMDPYSGEIKAWVGGINHKYFQFDHVNINTKRQVGSTIKPLLYCLAVDNGFSPCGVLSTMPQDFPEKKNYDAGGSEYGQLPMSRALAMSVNNAALYLIKQVGVNAFVDFMRKCGITSHVDKYPSIALGAPDISLYEMMGAYTMFPTGGIHVKPMFISKIEDKNGVLVKNFVPEQKELINANTAYKMVKLMQGVTGPGGTAVRLRYRYGFDGEIAGKTGTTNKQADAWFIGYTPQIIAGAWVGCDDRYLRFGSQALGQGAAAALPIWALFMKRVYADKSLNIVKDAKFMEPEGFDDCNALDPTSVDRSSTYDQSGYYEEYTTDSGQRRRVPMQQTQPGQFPANPGQPNQKPAQPAEPVEQIPNTEWD
ncbi:MAG: penicillin-binding protein [Flavipsychrobacter sp.]|nr:penicillin-binding protein [Flavipsychrobacter sp.]